MRITAVVAILSALGAAACSHGAEGPPGPPDLTPIAGAPAPANARLYADCIARAAANGTYRRADDGDGTEVILFTCEGPPALAFYEALGPWSRQIDSEFAMDGRTFRSTARVQRNLFGVDYCSASAAGDHRCVITFNAGDFVDQ